MKKDISKYPAWVQKMILEDATKEQIERETWRRKQKKKSHVDKNKRRLYNSDVEKKFEDRISRLEKQLEQLIDRFNRHLSGEVEEEPPF